MPRVARRLSKPTRAIRRRLVGFDVEIAELVARKLGRTPQFLQVQFTSLDQSAKRGDFDIGLSGIEDIPARRQSLAASIPYYEFREVLTVREGDRDRYRSLADLKGSASPHSAARSPTTCSSKPSATHGITAVSYDDDVHPYSDLVLGRVDARRARQRPRRSRDAPEQRPGHASRRRSPSATTSCITAPENTALRDQVDRILRDAMSDGTLEAIFKKWNVWNDDQPTTLCALLTSGDCAAAVGNSAPTDTDLAISRPLRSVAVSRGAHHTGAVIRWRWRWQSHLVC